MRLRQTSSTSGSREQYILFHLSTQQPWPDVVYALSLKIPIFTNTSDLSSVCQSHAVGWQPGKWRRARVPAYRGTATSSKYLLRSSFARANKCYQHNGILSAQRQRPALARSAYSVCPSDGGPTPVTATTPIPANQAN